MPSGQAAQLVISQTGVNGRTPNLIRDFSFTAEVVSVHTNQGNTSPAATPPAPTAATSSSSPTASLAAVPPAAADAIFGNVLNTNPLATGL